MGTQSVLIGGFDTGGYVAPTVFLPKPKKYYISFAYFDERTHFGSVVVECVMDLGTVQNLTETLGPKGKQVTILFWQELS